MNAMKLTRLVFFLLCSSPALSLAAAPAAAAPDDTPSGTGSSTDVIGSKEAPAVLNIVPWKDRNAAPVKKEVSTSILKETLQPLDQDVLQREIYFKQNLDR
jgi:hypothetical protein